MKVWQRKKPEPPKMPNQPDPPVKERIIERHIVERVEGAPGRDGVDGRNAIPTALYRYSVTYRRDARNRSQFVFSSIVSETARDAAFAGPNLQGLAASLPAPCLLRTSLGSGINNAAVVGVKFDLVHKGEDVLKAVLPEILRPNVRDSVAVIPLTLTIEAYEHE